MFDNITAISWEFGDGSSSDEEDPEHFYSLPGSYRVKLMVTGPGGINTIEREVTLTEGDLTIPPSQLGLDPFYKKYLNASGIPVISSEYVPHAALKAVKEMIQYIIAKNETMATTYASHNGRVGIMGEDEVTTDIPEHSDLYDVFPGTDWDQRARGLGATLERPISTCAEENVLCYSNDRYRGEDIFIHEFAHSLHLLALRFIDSDFDTKLLAAYNNAIDNGLWDNTYAQTNELEYWAEGVQSWYNVNIEATPTNGIHNYVDTHEELKDYDPLLFDLISIYFNPPDQTNPSCN